MSAPPTVVLTRSAQDNAQWAPRLEAQGLGVISLPCIRSEPINDAHTRAAIMSGLKRAGCLALTSRRGAEAVAQLASPIPPRLTLACVGSRTAQVAEDLFARGALVPTEQTGRGLAEALIPLYRGSKLSGPVLITAAEKGLRDLDAALTEAGVEVIRIAVYRTLPAAAEATPADLGRAQVIFLASPSAVTGLVNLCHGPPPLPAVTIGPTTTAAAARAGLNIIGEATRRDLHGMVAALTESLQLNHAGNPATQRHL